MSQAEQIESLERTLAELEAQQSAAQQVIEEALAELEDLYVELEERSQQLANVDPDGADPFAEAQVGELQQELEATRQQRDSLREQLEAAQAVASEIGAAVSDVADHAAPSPEAEPAPAALPTSALRTPFELLRSARQGE